MKTNKIIKILFCLALFASPIIAHADDLGDGNPDTIDEVPLAPIEDYIPVALLAASGLGYLFLRKKALKE